VSSSGRVIEQVAGYLARFAPAPAALPADVRLQVVEFEDGPAQLWIRPHVCRPPTCSECGAFLVRHVEGTGEQRPVQRYHVTGDPVPQPPPRPPARARGLVDAAVSDAVDRLAAGTEAPRTFVEGCVRAELARIAGESLPSAFHLEAAVAEAATRVGFRLWRGRR